MSQHPTTASLPWVVVRVGPSRLAIPSEVVRELLVLPAITGMPGLPADVQGVMQWRGQVVPVVDLRARLQLGGDVDAASQRRMAAVVGVAERIAALAVDAVEGVEPIAQDSIEDIPLSGGVLGRIVRRHARLRRDGSLVLVLDVPAALGTRIVDDESQSAPAVPRDNLPDDSPGVSGQAEASTPAASGDSKVTRRGRAAPRAASTAPSAAAGSRSSRRRTAS